MNEVHHSSLYSQQEIQMQGPLIMLVLDGHIHVHERSLRASDKQTTLR